MKNILQDYSDENDLLDLVLTRYSRYLSNESMKMLGQRKEVIKELVAKIGYLEMKYEKESKKEVGKSRDEKPEQVQDNDIQTKSRKGKTETKRP